MLYFLTEYTLIIYVQYIIGSKRKNFISFREIVRERFTTFRFRQHFKRLKLDDSSTETVSNQKKIRTIFLMTAYSWRTDKHMEINYYPI